MKRAILIVAVILTQTIVYAQTSSSVSNSVLSGRATTNYSTTNTSETGSFASTNQSDTFYSLQELDRHLQTLQTEVEQTLPLLTAFNTSYAATNSSGGAAQTLGDLLGKVFSRKHNQTDG